MIKKILSLISAFLIIFCITGCKNNNTSENINFDIEGNVSAEFDSGSSNPEVAKEIDKYGTIVIELYPSVAPNTVNNFISLVKNGFYDNNTFHRLVPGFILQGGNDLEEIGCAEFIPFCSNDQGIGSLECIVLVFGIFDLVAHHLLNILHCFGVECGYCCACSQ